MCQDFCDCPEKDLVARNSRQAFYGMNSEARRLLWMRSKSRIVIKGNEKTVCSSFHYSFRFLFPYLCPGKASLQSRSSVRFFPFFLSVHLFIFSI